MATEIKRILVPMDFSPNADQAKDMADAIAAKFGAEVELLHVVENPPYEVYVQKGFMGGAPMHEPLGEAVPSYNANVIVKDLVEESRKELEKTAALHTPPYRAKVRNGHVVDEVLREIEEYKPDMVVMSTHGWTGFKHLMLGSVAEKVVRFSPVPVLITKGTQAR